MENMKEWKDRLIEAEKGIMGKVVKVPLDPELIKKKQKWIIRLLSEYDKYREDIREHNRKYHGTSTFGLPPIREFKSWDKLDESCKALLDIPPISLKYLLTSEYHGQLYFPYFYYNIIVPSCGFVLPGVDGRLSWFLNKLEVLMTEIFGNLAPDARRKMDRIRAGRKKSAALREERKRVVFYAYKNLREKDENNKLRKKVDFVKKIEREMNGPGYFAKFKKPPSSRSILRFLDELTAEGRIHPPWKRSQT